MEWRLRSPTFTPLPEVLGVGRSRHRSDKDFIRQLALEVATEYLTLQIDDLHKVNPRPPGGISRGRPRHCRSA